MSFFDNQVVSTENHENGLIAIVHCKEMDFAAGEALKEAIDRAVAAQPCQRCVIDLSAVNFLPSVGIGALLQVLNSSKAENRELILVGVDPKIREVLRLSAIEKLFVFHDDPGAALS